MNRLTIIAIAAIATSITVGYHEGIHALTCELLGGDLKSYSALYVDCAPGTILQDKLVAGSASLANILLGLIFLFCLRRSSHTKPELQFFLWLLMLMNLLYGAGYWLFSGMSNIGDWAVVIADLKPQWIYRLGMVALGSITFMGFIWLSLQELGKIIGGQEPELFKRSRNLTITSYFTALLVILIAGALCPLGFTSSPVVAGLMGAAGTLSPLLWMTEWFQAKMFTKNTKLQPLKITLNLGYIIASVIVIILYAVVLSQNSS